MEIGKAACGAPLSWTDPWQNLPVTPVTWTLAKSLPIVLPKPPVSASVRARSVVMMESVHPGMCKDQTGVQGGKPAQHHT